MKKMNTLLCKKHYSIWYYIKYKKKQTTRYSLSPPRHAANFSIFGEIAVAFLTLSLQICLPMQSVHIDTNVVRFLTDN
jgi:hypothetical protein